MTILRKTGDYLKSWADTVQSVSFRRDFFVVAGLAMIFHGLYLFLPWLAFAVVGVLILAGGILMYLAGGE